MGAEDTRVCLRPYVFRSLLQVDTKDVNVPFPISIKTLTGRILNIYVNSAMTVEELKMKIQDKEGIPPEQQRLVVAGVQMIGERTLTDYKIQNGSVVYMSLRLRGGMFHFISGRQEFEDLPCESATAIKNVLELKFTDVEQLNRMTPADLQNSILEAQDILSTLQPHVQPFVMLDNLRHLKTIQSLKMDNNEDRVRMMTVTDTHPPRTALSKRKESDNRTKENEKLEVCQMTRL